MTHIQGSFVLTRDVNTDEIVRMSDERARALALTDPTRPDVTATFQSMRSPAVDGVHLSTPLSSDDEDDDNIQRPQTTTRTVLPDDLYDTDLDSADDKVQRAKTTTRAVFRDDLYDTDLDSDDDQVKMPQNTTRTLFSDDLCDTDLDSDDENERSHNRTAKKLYLSNCKKYGITQSSILMNIIVTSSPSVVIRFSAMKPLDVKVMVLSLNMSKTVTKVDLGGNGFGSLGAIYLAKSIANSEYIAELDLSDNDIGQTGCKALCDALLSCRSINTLILDGNRLDDKCAEYIAKLLVSHKYLVYVSLAKHLFENVSTANSFSAALADNQSIENFDISFNHFHQETIGIFINFLSRNFHLRSLNLSCSSFGLAASKAFSLAMQTKNTQLEELDLSSNFIDDECAKYLGRVLSTNESLKKLNLMQNPLSVHGCLAILKPLKTMPTSQLERIDMRDIYVKSQDFIDLATDLEDEFKNLVIRRGERVTYPPLKK